MWRIAILITVAVVGLVEACTYKTAECADYTVIETHPDYEVRSYVPLSWATTSVTAQYRRVGQYTAFRRLFKYISGQNDREQKMAMTVPVRMSSTKSGNETIFEMDFMVPSQFAANPPVPNDDNIKIVKEDTTMYAVRTFKGYIWRESQWLEEAEKLAESVKEDDTVIRTSFFQVGYDAPFDLFDRRNEIWMVKKVEQQTNEV